MSIADFFESGEMKEHKGAFRNLVMIARADGVVSAAEEKMLERMARRLDLSEDQVNEILAHPEQYPIMPPHNTQERRERMVDLVRMLMADGEFDAHEMEVLVQCAVGLGYESDEVPHMVNRIRYYLNEGLNRDAVIDAMLAEQ